MGHKEDAAVRSFENDVKIERKMKDKLERLREIHRLTAIGDITHEQREEMTKEIFPNFEQSRQYGEEPSQGGIREYPATIFQ